MSDEGGNARHGSSAWSSEPFQRVDDASLREDLCTGICISHWADATGGTAVAVSGSGPRAPLGGMMSAGRRYQLRIRSLAFWNEGARGAVGRRACAA